MNGMNICLTNNYLPLFSFISMIWSESETNLELHKKNHSILIGVFMHYAKTEIWTNTINSQQYCCI